MCIHGMSCCVADCMCSLSLCSQSSAFMKEAHIHAAANFLKATILVFDDRDRAAGKPGLLLCYEPGYVKPAYMIKQTVAEQMVRDLDTLWIHLTPGHFTTLRRNA
eukprot:2297028-Prymnesium_polylepis.2